MKVSTRTRYALRFLIELSLHENDQEEPRRLTTEQIAVNQGISEKYLEAIAAKLKKAGYISSVRGVNGGYSLAMKPATIVVGDIMRLMESTYFATHCVDDYELCCNNYPTCVLTDFWNGLEAVITNYVDNLTLEQIRDSIIGRQRDEALQQQKAQ